MLSGDNGILQRAATAKDNTESAQIKEKIQLAYLAGLAGDNGSIDKASFRAELQKEFGAEKVTDNTIDDTTQTGKWIVTIDGVTVELEARTTTTPLQIPETTLPTNTGTIPYLPKNDGTWHQVTGTDLITGLVITDEVDANENSIGNEYVWIEVPNNLYGATEFGPTYPTGTTSTDYTAIKTALLVYTETLLDATGSDRKATKAGWLDEWYDSSNKTVEESSNTSDRNGCGLTSTEYTELYNAMLSSIFVNGGFWIGRYEAGIDGSDTDSTLARDYFLSLQPSTTMKPVSKINAIVNNNLNCRGAQYLTKNVESGDYNSSLMFGIQWDLVLKYIEERTVANKVATRTSIQSAIKSDSKEWGNYTDCRFTLNRGKYTQVSPWKVYIDYTTGTTNKVTVAGNVSTKVGTTWANRILLTTGASDNNVKLNIYDLAGNVYEFTLEHAKTSTTMPSACRGGECDYS